MTGPGLAALGQQLGYATFAWRPLHILPGTPDPDGDPGELLPAGWHVLGEPDDGDGVAVWLTVEHAVTRDGAEVDQAAAEHIARALEEHATLAAGLNGLAAELDRLQGVLHEVAVARRGEHPDVDQEPEDLPDEIAADKAFTARTLQQLAVAQSVLAEVLDERRWKDRELYIRALRQNGAVHHATNAELTDWRARATAAGATIPTRPATAAADTTGRY